MSSHIDDPYFMGGGDPLFNDSFGDNLQTGDVDVDVELLADAFFDGSNNIEALEGELEKDLDIFCNSNNNNNNTLDLDAYLGSEGSFNPTIIEEVSSVPSPGADFALTTQQQSVRSTSVTPPAPSPPLKYSTKKGIAHQVVPQMAPAHKNENHYQAQLLKAQQLLMAQQQQQQQPQQQQQQQFMMPPPQVSSVKMTQPKVYTEIAPAIPAVAVANSMSVAADPTQQAFIFTTLNENGEPVQAAIPNPFLAMAAPQYNGGSNPAEDPGFLSAAMDARQKGRRRQVTPEQELARRERNRELAKKTRDRKKDYMDGLQDEVMELQRANAELKALAKLHMDEKDSTSLLDQCDAIDKVPDTVWEACGINPKEVAAEDFDMVSSIQKSQTAFCITDPSFDDNPIVFVSPDFLAMTGYSREQVIGRNCRFLQGEATCPDKLEEIRVAMAEGEDVGVTIANYKADGTPFWNRLFIAAVRDINDNVVNYMGVTVEVARPEPDDPEHDKVLQ